MEKSPYQKSLQSRIAKLQSKYNEVQNKQEAVVGKLPGNPTQKQKIENMEEWLKANQNLRKTEQQLSNTKRLLARAQGLHKATHSN